MQEGERTWRHASLGDGNFFIAREAREKGRKKDLFLSPLLTHDNMRERERREMEEKDLLLLSLTRMCIRKRRRYGEDEEEEERGKKEKGRKEERVRGRCEERNTISPFMCALAQACKRGRRRSCECKQTERVQKRGGEERIFLLPIMSAHACVQEKRKERRKDGKEEKAKKEEKGRTEGRG